MTVSFMRIFKYNLVRKDQRHVRLWAVFLPPESIQPCISDRVVNAELFDPPCLTYLEVIYIYNMLGTKA